MRPGADGTTRDQIPARPKDVQNGGRCFVTRSERRGNTWSNGVGIGLRAGPRAFHRVWRWNLILGVVVGGGRPGGSGRGCGGEIVIVRFYFEYMIRVVVCFIHTSGFQVYWEPNTQADGQCTETRKSTPKTGRGLGS